MKELIALAVFLAIVTPTVVFALKKHIGPAIAAVFFCFALVSGWAIVNYDRIGAGPAAGMSQAEFEKKLLEARTAAVEEVKKAAEEQKQLIASLLATVKDARTAAEVERKSVEVLAERLKRTEDNLKVIDKTAADRADRAERARDQAADIQRATSDLALALTRLAYYSMEAKEQFGADRAKEAADQMAGTLDEVVKLAIPDPKGRDEFINEVTSSLPPRQ